ncbi:hypothetical protein GXW74_20605 [Roseomonas eburnea]|uniref:Copper chaperone PCu(A)C n=1 Tax=Neoroseomonas eburnea TaxID=1346889 RepID=A0A9X9XGR9_9PROT|nr:hypothetical protein [Neoroseomonas eburnea]MBR0682905.1 hypothetical protein [Neoroseomonas eburnea]
MHRRRLLAAAALLPALTHGARAHTTRGPNGGQLIDLAGGHGELVAEGNELRLFLSDNADRPRSVEGATGQAVVLAGGRQATVTLAPAGANVMRGQGDFTAATGMRVVVTVTLPGQRPAQGRFTPRDSE